MQIRPANAEDLKPCAMLDHSVTTDRVWQMETREEGGVLTTTFRVVDLPREVEMAYPREGEGLLAAWHHRDEFLVAEEQGRICGYVAMTADPEHDIVWVGDLVVDRPMRRQGVGTALLRSAGRWGLKEGLGWLTVGVKTKNHPAIAFCRAAGLTFCGYSDPYWPGRDIGLLFGAALR